MERRAKPIVVLGPTAGGKSALAAGLAERLGGDVLGADSMQVYRHMDAGTAKPPASLRRRVPHHLIDLVEPTQRFTVHGWLSLAEPLIAGLRDAGRVPVVVGGTNLYLKALLEGIFDGPGRDESFRASLEMVAEAELHDRLSAVDPEAASRIAPADRQRLTRALEVHHLTGQPISAQQTQWEAGGREQGVGNREAGNAERGAGSGKPENVKPPSPTPYHLIGLRWPVEAINRRINLRVRVMFEPGKFDEALAAEVCLNGESLPDEVRRLHDAGLLPPGSQAAEALGYKQCLAALAPREHPRAADPKIKTLEDAMERTKILTRRFAKQQRTWLKRFAEVHWIDCDDQTTDAQRLESALRGYADNRGDRDTQRQ